MQGLILLNKPQGITSFSAVAQVRRIFGEKRAGHTGTLDPMATGVLPVLLGRATRLSSLMLESDKRYLATVLFGVQTDTLDITGTVLARQEAEVSRSQLEEALVPFRGVIQQKPPMYSAIKKDGRRLYDLARQGIEVEREARTVEIKRLEIVEQTDEGHYVLDVLCSKGTYIRSLVDDIGRVLGCGATLCGLQRTLSAGFSLSECVALEELEKEPRRYLLSADRCVAHWPRVTVTDNQRRRFLHGGELFLNRLELQGQLPVGGHARVYARDGAWLGLGTSDGVQLKVHCVLYGGESE